MKSVREKAAKILTYVYASGIAIALFAGAISSIAYLVAMVIGGDTAAEICRFTYKDFYPVIIYISSVSILIGLLKMYISGEKSLVPTKKNKKQ